MKFLLFNLVVAAALVFLFSGDRADIGATVAALSNKAQDIATDTKLQPAAPAKPVVPAALPAKKEPAADPVAPAAVPVEQTGKPARAAAPETLKRRVASASPPKAPVLPPDVAERREKVLGDLLPDGKGEEKIIEVDPKKFMSPEQRRRDLILLSEEMELFSAGTLGR